MKQEKKIVYYAYNHDVAFTGTAEECLRWLMGQAIRYNNNIWRTWTENGNTYYDIGTVYIFNS